MHVYVITVLSLGLGFVVTGSPIPKEEYKQDYEKYTNDIIQSTECVANRDVLALFSKQEYELGYTLSLIPACGQYENDVQAKVCSILLNQLTKTCNNLTLYETTLTNVFKNISKTLHFGVNNRFEDDNEMKICQSALKRPDLDSLKPICDVCNVDSSVRIACIMLWQMNIAPKATTTFLTSAAGSTSGSSPEINPDQKPSLADNGDETKAHIQSDEPGGIGATGSETNGTTSKEKDENAPDGTGTNVVNPANVTRDDKAPGEGDVLPQENYVNGGDRNTGGTGDGNGNEGTGTGSATDVKAPEEEDAPPENDASRGVLNTGETGDGKEGTGTSTAIGDKAAEEENVAPPENDVSDGAKNTDGDDQVTNIGSDFDTSSLITSPLCSSGTMLEFYQDVNLQNLSPFNAACKFTKDPAEIQVCQSALDVLKEYCLGDSKYKSIANDVSQWNTLNPNLPVQSEENLCQAAFQKIPENTPSCEVCSVGRPLRSVCYMLWYLNYFMTQQPTLDVSKSDEGKNADSDGTSTTEKEKEESTPEKKNEDGTDKEGPGGSTTSKEDNQENDASPGVDTPSEQGGETAENDGRVENPDSEVGFPFYYKGSEDSEADSDEIYQPGITGDENQNLNKEDKSNDNTYVMYKNRKFEEEESSSHFLAYSLTAIILILATYIAYHNKHKIIAVIIEGRTGKGGRRGGSYRRLNQNVSS